MCSTSILISFSQLSAGFPNVLNYSGSPDKIFIPFSLVPRTLGCSKLNDLISSPSYQLLNITNFEHLQHAVCYRARVRTYRTHDVEYNGAPRIQTLVIRIGLVLRVNLSRILQNELVWNYRFSDQVRYSVMAYRTSNQAWSKGLNAGTYSRTSKCQCSLFPKKTAIIQIFCISGWLAVPINPDKWSSTVLEINVSTLSNIEEQIPTRCHLLFYCTSYKLNMFRALLCPSPEARDYNVDYHTGRFVLDLL